ncbi:alkaline phosphatase family protein [Lutispora thermophila]|uniref:2,3-bisphosphoglycerate-independent phosphoglycerate mutase n=1 Tax=Lutispora thermophila DSM 19022 TaxID=1122184 RepID=A0A1M6FT86_9FIRM|nr:hypothetical protein [Lutispora thermophila]SHJ00892.1 2,3-bisphosphoglycerate-independent phosphoglycerate mutase [Lutispora thermophila DSM 19022]
MINFDNKKTILIILDGLSEERISELSNLTPLEYALTPTIDKIKDQGVHIKKVFCPDKRDPDSMTCILSMLGVEESIIPRNRAYLEAISSNIIVNEDEVAMRCNLVKIMDNKLQSFNGEGLSRCDMAFISHNIKTVENLRFYHISDYRNLLILKRSEEIMEIPDLPPHENMGMSIEDLTKDLLKNEELFKFIEDNKFVVNNNEYMFYPWGVSEAVKLPSFEELHGKTCSLICNAEIVKGIGKAMKVHIPDLKNSTGDIDTDLKEKARMVIKEIETHDVVIAHINGTDEVSHRKDILGKVLFIERLDREFINEIYNSIGRIKLIIASDHQTSSITGKHKMGPVDVICNQKYL